MKKIFRFAFNVFALCIIAPQLAFANAITEQQAKAEHMRACLSGGNNKDVCLCSFERASQEIGVDRLMEVNRALTNNIPADDTIVKKLARIASACDKEIMAGTYLPGNTVTKPQASNPTLPTIPTIPSLPIPTNPDGTKNNTAPTNIPAPPSFKDLDNLTIPAPPAIEKSSPNFDEEAAKEGSESYFTDTTIDANEDPAKVAQKSVPSTTSAETPLNVQVANIRDKYQGQHDAAFFAAAARGDIKALTAINQYLKNPDIIDRFGNTPLIIAVQNGQVNAAGFLLEKGANVNYKNKNGQTPLHIATFKKRQDIIQLLLRNKADANLAYGNGFTPLILALMNQDETALQTLIIAGANVKLAMLDGNLPIHVATSTDNPRLIQILKNYGADLNAENAQGYTPLMVAASQNKVNSASALLALGANYNLTDVYGRTAAQIAYSLGNQQIVNLVLTMQEKQAGAY